MVNHHTNHRNSWYINHHGQPSTISWYDSQLMFDYRLLRWLMVKGIIIMIHYEGLVMERDIPASFDHDGYVWDNSWVRFTIVQQQHVYYSSKKVQQQSSNNIGATCWSPRRRWFLHYVCWILRPFTMYQNPNLVADFLEKPRNITQEFSVPDAFWSCTVWRQSTPLSLDRHIINWWHIDYTCCIQVWSEPPYACGLNFNSDFVDEMLGIWW